MNRFYRKPKPETMKKNRDTYRKAYPKEMKWLKENLQILTQSKNKFLIDMYTIMITGSRKITPKMADAIRNGIERCKNNPLYNPELKEYPVYKELMPFLTGIASAGTPVGGDWKVGIKVIKNYITG